MKKKKEEYTNWLIPRWRIRYDITNEQPTLYHTQTQTHTERKRQIKKKFYYRLLFKHFIL